MEARLLKRSSASRQGDLSEAELLNLVRSGDASGMRAFYERYVGFLTAVCSRYVPDRAAVKDILQEVFVKVWKALPETLQSCSARFQTATCCAKSRQLPPERWLPVSLR